MDVKLRPVCHDDIEALVQLSLSTWNPVVQSFREILGPAIYSRIWPDWNVSQRSAVESICCDEDKYTVWVAEADGKPVGFIAWELNESDKSGEVQLLAVHPDYHNHGIGTDLNRLALAQMRENGVVLAKAETGGDPSHAPARTSYEKAGYTGLPLVRYFQDLTLQ